MTPEQAAELLRVLAGLWPDEIEDEELDVFDASHVREALDQGARALSELETLELELHIPDDTDPFEAYFNVADEIYEGLALPRRPLDQTESGHSDANRARLPRDGKFYLTLADLDSDWVATAKRFADEHADAPWPPYLPFAEEHSNDLREQQFRQDRNWEGV